VRFVPGTKRLGHDAEHSPLSSDQVKNEWSYNSIPPYPFMASAGTYLSFYVKVISCIEPNRKQND